MTGDETDVLDLVVGETNDLVAPDALRAAPMGKVRLGFVAPYSDQLLGRGAQDMGADVTLAVAAESICGEISTPRLSAARSSSSAMMRPVPQAKSR